MFRALRRLLHIICFGRRKFLVCVVFCGVSIYLLHIFNNSESRQVWDGDIDVTSLISTTGLRCGVKCTSSQYAFYIRSGQEDKMGPIICFENTIYMSPSQKNVGRGINAVFLTGSSGKLIGTQTFDTYNGDVSFVKYVKNEIKEGDIILIASFDEMTYGLKDNGKRWLKMFGSEMIDVVKYRDSLIMIGQKGLQPGSAIEYHNAHDGNDFAAPLVKTGCFSVPLGTITGVEDVIPHVAHHPKIEYGMKLLNCGSVTCPADTYSVMVDTGKANNRYPTICVNDRIIMGENLNGAGRGFNIVIFDPKLGRPTMVGNFDTYLEDSTNLEIILESLTGGEIVIAAVYDDGSKQLSIHCKALLNKLGSGYVQNIKFRDAWYFVGQEGLEGFTNMEQISYAGFENQWPAPIKKSFCVPKKIVGTQIIPDPHVYRNDKKRDFCTKFDGFPEFCDPMHIDEKINAIGVVDKKFADHKIFSTPIIIVPGLDHNSLVRTLQTTIMQPGVKPKNVWVMWDEKLKEQAEVADLFGFRNHSLQSSTTYADILRKALEDAWTIMPDEKYMIFIEEDLLLASDFLSYMAKCMAVLDEDPTLAAASAYNYNGFDGCSSDQSLLYRVNDHFPGLGFLLRKDFFQESIVPNLQECCNNRAWDGWEVNQADILIPDVSRVYRPPYQGVLDDPEFAEDLFFRRRVTNLNPQAKLKGLKKLNKMIYDNYTGHHLVNGTVLSPAQLQECFSEKHHVPSLPSEGSSFIIYFRQKTIDDYTVVNKLCKCYGLFSSGNHKPYNLYHNMLRFTYQGHDMFMVGSKSPFIKYKPPNLPLLTSPDVAVSQGGNFGHS